MKEIMEDLIDIDKEKLKLIEAYLNLIGCKLYFKIGPVLFKLGSKKYKMYRYIYKKEGKMIQISFYKYVLNKELEGIVFSYNYKEKELKNLDELKDTVINNLV